jgi:hypothetical protein
LSALKKKSINDKKQSGIVIVAAMMLLLLAGMILAPTQASALSKFNTNTGTSSLKHGIRDGVSVKLEHRDQHMNQENLCYRTNTCRQANDGQNTLGNDNSITGFADQSDNIQQSAAAPTTTTTAPGNQTGGNNTTPTPTPRTCEQCFTSILTAGQLANVTAFFGLQNTTALCENLTITAPLITETTFRDLLSSANSSITTTIANDLIACLRAAGIVFSGP